MSYALRRALERLVAAWQAGPLTETDPQHLLAFAVIRAYLEAHTWRKARRRRRAPDLVARDAQRQLERIKRTPIYPQELRG